MALFLRITRSGLLGLRDGPRKFIYELNSSRPRMFDLEGDPLERVDRSGKLASESRWYEQDLRSWSASQKDFLWSGLQQP
jgi:hypothetical protein